MKYNPNRSISGTVVTFLFLTGIVLLIQADLASDDNLREIEKPVYEINFDYKNSSSFMTFRELELWARNHNLLVVSDLNYRNLLDGQAGIIKENGLSFRLYVQQMGRNYLYLDLVTYRPNGEYQFSKVRWMDVYGNGELLQTIYQGGGAFLESPIRIIIDREHARKGYVDIELRPSPGDGFWAIWDAFMSNSHVL